MNKNDGYPPRAEVAIWDGVWPTKRLSDLVSSAARSVAQQEQAIEIEPAEQHDEVESLGERPAVGLVAARLLQGIMQELIDLAAGGVQGGEQVLLAALVGEDEPLHGVELSLGRRGGVAIWRRRVTRPAGVIS